jgi:hypothetical protein
LPRIPVDNLGSAGLIRDIFAHDTPPEAWSFLQNARMGGLGAEKFLGHDKALGTGTAGWAVAPYWLMHVPVAGSTGMWACLGQQKIYCRSAQSPYTETNITRQTAGVDVNYSANESGKWNGGMFGGLAIFNDAAQDEPQYWNGASATKVKNFSAAGGVFPWDATHRAAVVRPFGRFLVAVDITKGATRYPQLVKWSNQADPGAMPTSWDPTDVTKDAGEYPLQDASGVLVDQRVLRNINQLYTTDQVWSMRYVQGGLVMGFEPAFLQQGALGANCIAHFKSDGENHLVLGGDDVFQHNGQVARSVISPALRRWFFQQMDPTYYARSFVVPNPTYNEIWVCIPEVGAEQPTLAMVWNWETGAVGFRDLLKASSTDTRTTASTKGTPCIARGFIDDVSLETWDADSGTWDSDTTIWDARTTSPATPRMLMADRSAGKRTFLLDNTAQFDGSNFDIVLERVGLSIIGHDRQGNPKNDTETNKLVLEIWPRVEGTPGDTLTIYVGTQDSQDAAVTWSSPYTYTVGQDEFVSVYECGRYVAIRFVHSSGIAMRLLGYALQLEAAGSYA